MVVNGTQDAERQIDMKRTDGWVSGGKAMTSFIWVGTDVRPERPPFFIPVDISMSLILCQGEEHAFCSGFRECFLWLGLELAINLPYFDVLFC